VSKKNSKMGPRFQIKSWFELINLPTWLPAIAPSLSVELPTQQIAYETTRQDKPAHKPAKRTGPMPWETEDDSEPDATGGSYDED
jgi:hypothetical protein